MMFPPIYERAKADAAIVALLGMPGGELRLWSFGEAPHGAALPYATWQQIGGLPANNVSDRPDADYFSIQVNVWGVSSNQTWAVTKALRDIMEVNGATIVRWGNTVKDAETEAFGYDFDADWITYR